MRTFFLNLANDNTPVDPQNGQRIGDALDRWGSPGKLELASGERFYLGDHAPFNLANPSRAFAPAFFSESGEWMAFDGRIDNRAQLKSRLGLDNSNQLDDQQLFYQFYKSQGIENLREVVGPYVFTVFEVHSNKVVAGRDCMGGRYLAYHHVPGRLVLANSILSMMTHPELDYKVNEARLVAALGFVNDQNPETMMRDVFCVKPGHVLIFNGNELTERCFYLPNPRNRITDASSGELATEFRRLLDQSIQRRVSGLDKVGSMLSGGLDSLPMTVIATQQMQKPSDLHAFTWVFDKFTTADERQYIGDSPKRYGFLHREINCDQVWPSLDQQSFSPVMPITTPYDAFHDASASLITQTDIQVVLSGVGGDSLYSGHQKVILELLKAFRFSDAWTESKTRIGDSQSMRAFIKAHLIKQLPYFYLVEKFVTKRYKPAWLTSYACSLLSTEDWLRATALKARRPYQYINLIGLLEGQDAHIGRINDGKFGFEKRLPYRTVIWLSLCLPYLQANCISAVCRDPSFVTQRRIYCLKTYCDDLTKLIFTRLLRTEYCVQ